MQMSDKEAHEARAFKETSKDEKSPKKVRKMCSHLLINMCVLHKLEFLIPLLSSVEDSENQDRSESENKDARDLAYS